ncbi:MAG: flagellar basal body P-ring formation protein FlgA [Pseudomonadota bacterium]|nr:flagellar basal body P-ring formation protein FlgA [Pseudomonadota bacterium]
MSARLLLLACGVALALASPATATEMRAPSPKAIIYPGEIITEDRLEDSPLAPPTYGGPVALAPEDVLGMMATRTLLPGRSIPMSALSPPRVVRAGAPVKMLYIDGALTIVTAGSALQDGAVGQTVKVRNDDSGVTVSGRVRGDGSVMVSGG